MQVCKAPSCDGCITKRAYFPQLGSEHDLNVSIGTAPEVKRCALRSSMVIQNAPPETRQAKRRKMSSVLGFKSVRAARIAEGYRSCAQRTNEKGTLCGWKDREA